MSNLISYIYNSAASTEFSQEDLLELLERSRNFNGSTGVTGILLLVDQCFFQVLEGPLEEVEALVEKIRSDKRHTNMTTIIREPIAQRSFSAWTMGFASISSRELGDIEGLNDFFTGQNVLTDIDEGRARKLLQAFSKGRWRVKLSAPKKKMVSLTTADNSTVSRTSRPDFSFAFQPVIDARNRSVAGYEARLRGKEGEPAEQVVQQLALNDICEFDAEARRLAIGQS
ncbi:MAG: diguanylate phosphodiesterase, partial [Pseudomonadota bacterium]